MGREALQADVDGGVDNLWMIIPPASAGYLDTLRSISKKHDAEIMNFLMTPRFTRQTTHLHRGHRQGRKAERDFA